MRVLRGLWAPVCAMIAMAMVFPANPLNPITTSAAIASEAGATAEPELKARQKAGVQPEAISKPFLSTVTCVAGCSGQPGKNVYKGMSQATGLMQEVKPGAIPASTAAEGPQKVDCLAGCYDVPKSYSARPAPVPQLDLPKGDIKRDARLYTPVHRPTGQIAVARH